MKELPHKAARCDFQSRAEFTAFQAVVLSSFDPLENCDVESWQLTRDLVPAEGVLLDEILTATFGIWHEGLSRGAYERYYAGQLALPWGRAHLRRWALVEAAAVLASAKTYRFEAMLDGQSIRVVGLGAVFTQPAHRGRGHARVLVDRLLERAAADGADLALLFPKSVPITMRGSDSARFRGLF
jgi:GNAT superfamily N-acetyltransferase